MNLKLKHISLLLLSILLSACAMDNKSVKSSNETIEMATSDEEIISTETFDDKASINTPLINQKLQDFYDLIALQNQHPEFTDEVKAQLKNYTNDTITNFETENIVIIENLKPIENFIQINDSTQKIKLKYTKVMNNIKLVDTIYAIITNKKILIENETLISNKVHFSKN